MKLQFKAANSVLGFLIFLGTAANAQQKALTDMSLEELLDVQVYSANRRGSSAQEASSMITVLTGDELARWGAENLADGLRQVSAVMIRRAPGDFPQYNAAIRGNTSDFMNMRTLFVIDGVPVRNPNAGFDPSWIPISIIKRVEIMRGPASSLWGANAFGGLVHVVTKSGSDFKDRFVDAGLGYRSHRDPVSNEQVGGGTGQLSAGADAGRVDYIASTQYNLDADSRSNYSGHKYQDVFGKVSYHVSDDMTLSLRSLLSFDRHQVAVSNAADPIKDDFKHVAGSLVWKIDAASDLTATAYYSGFEHVLPYTDALENYDNSGDGYGLNLQYSTSRSESHTVTGGLDIIAESGGLSTKEFDYSVFPAVAKRAGWDRKAQSTWALYGQYEYLGWQSYRPVIGFRYDQNSLYGGALSPRLGLSYLIHDGLNAYASVGRGFRAPVFNETQISGFGKIGKENLRPEITTTYEIGLKSIRPSGQEAIAIFLQDISEKIELENVGASTLKTYNNSGKAAIYGVDLGGTQNLGNGWRTVYSTTLLKSDDGRGERIEKLIEMKFVLSLGWSQDTWSADLIGTHESNQFYYNANATIPADSLNRIFVPPTTQFDLQVAKKFSSAMTGTLFVKNIADEKYKEEFSSFINQDGMYLPGRAIGVNLNASF